VCHGVLGWAALRGGRYDEALAKLDEARVLLIEVGAEKETLDARAWTAECRLMKGEHDVALGIADEILARDDAPDAVGKLTPLLQRVRGYAMLLQGDPFGAREAFDASLVAARERDDFFGVALTLTALADLDRLEGIEPPQESVDECRSILAKLKVRALPPMPKLDGIIA
jgi:tetratricopeptide (TPR) repeat protein